MIDLFIDGVRQKSSQNETRNIIHPANGKVVEVAQEASPVVQCDLLRLFRAVVLGKAPTRSSPRTLSPGLPVFKFW